MAASVTGANTAETNEVKPFDYFGNFGPEAALAMSRVLGARCLE
jgi:sulfur transfer protein SufE